MKILMCILVFIFVFNSSNAVENFKTIDKIDSKLKINNKELVILVFYGIGSCEKCFNQSRYLKELLLDTIKNERLRSVTAINLKREKELKAFSKSEVLDINSTIINADLILSEYGMNNLDYFALIDYKGNLLYKANTFYLEKNFNQEYDKLIKMINDYLEKEQ